MLLLCTQVTEYENCMQILKNYSPNAVHLSQHKHSLQFTHQLPHHMCVCMMNKQHASTFDFQFTMQRSLKELGDFLIIHMRMSGEKCF
jgi:hypothetical protein